MFVSKKSRRKPSERRSCNGFIFGFFILFDLRLRCFVKGSDQDDLRFSSAGKVIDHPFPHKIHLNVIRLLKLRTMAPAVSSNDDKYKENLAVYTNPAHDLKVVKTDIPEPGEGEVLVHIKATGICG